VARTEALLLLATALVACNSSKSGSSSGPCDPLAANASAKLGAILGVGKDDSGTLYVADEGDSQSLRVFVSKGKTLFRKHVLGSGERGTGDYTISFDGDSGSVALLIHQENGKATAMALGAADSKDFIGDPGAITSDLTIEGTSAISGFSVHDLPGEIEYVADVDDGSVMVVTHPADDYDEMEFRMFYGRPPVLDERHVTSVNRSGTGDTHIVFAVGNSSYDAYFTVDMTESDGGFSFHPGQGSLDEGNGKSVSVTQRWPTPTALSDFSFNCL
jgi:hypothetical protein